MLSIPSLEEQGKGLLLPILFLLQASHFREDLSIHLMPKLKPRVTLALHLQSVFQACTSLGSPLHHGHSFPTSPHPPLRAGTPALQRGNLMMPRHPLSTVHPLAHHAPQHCPLAVLQLAKHPWGSYTLSPDYPPLFLFISPPHLQHQVLREAFALLPYAPFQRLTPLRTRVVLWWLAHCASPQGPLQDGAWHTAGTRYIAIAALSQCLEILAPGPW